MNLKLVLVLLTTSALTASVVRADDAPPCASEAEAVKNMKKRDRSLEYPTDKGAKEKLELGKRAFGVGEYDKAILSYTEAGLLSDAPLILYNLGQTYRALKDYEKATRQYQLFLERGQPGAEVKALVACHIATMAAELEHAASTAPPQGPPPDHDEVVDGQEATEPAVDEARADQPLSPWTTKRKAAVGVGAAGVLVVAAGIVFGMQAGDFKDEAARICPSDPCARADEANRFSDKASTRATLANVSYGVGAAAIVGAAVLWFVGAPERSEEPADQTAIVPQLSSGFTGLALSGRF